MLVGGCAAPLRSGPEDNLMIRPALDIQAPIGNEYVSFGKATSWLNSKPLTSSDLKGKVILVSFWTYTCINWLRVEPNLAAWAEKYKDKGLVVVGVHTPEFEFEKDLQNVQRATVDLQVTYPVAVDSEYKIWNAFNNRYWPAIYFIDAKGQIRHHQFGEGNYDRSEKVIQTLLEEAGHEDIPSDSTAVEGQGVKAAADWDELRSPETYLGYGRTQNFASPEKINRAALTAFSFPTNLQLNQWALRGDWKVTESAAVMQMPNGRVAYRFHARDLHLVMGSADGNSSGRFRVLIDGNPPGASHGIDVDADGFGTVSFPRMYQLIRQSDPITDRRFEIEFLDSSVQIYAFTFG